MTGKQAPLRGPASLLAVFLVTGCADDGLDPVVGAPCLQFERGELMLEAGDFVVHAESGPAPEEVMGKLYVCKPSGAGAAWAPSVPRIVRGSVWADLSTTRTVLAGLESIEGTLELRLIEGDLELPDLTTLGGLREEIQGGGFAAGLEPQRISLPRLERTSADIEGSGRGNRLELPKLRESNGRIAYFRIDAPELLNAREILAAGELYVPRLVSTDANLFVYALVSEDTLVLPALTTVSGTLSLYQSDTATTATLPALERVGGAFIVNYNARLERLNAPRLQEIGGAASVTDNPRLPNCRIQALLWPEGEEVAMSVELRRNLDTCPDD